MIEHALWAVVVFAIVCVLLHPLLPDGIGKPRF